MKKQSGLLCSFVCSVSLMAVGCTAGEGGSSFSHNTLAGNWLIVGTLPVYPSNYPATYLNEAMTLNVTGDVVSGAGLLGVGCGNTEGDVPLTFGSSAVAPDGTFTLQSTSTPPEFQIHATSPVSASGTWSGTYTVTDGACPPGATGSFTATRIQDLTGTYAGPATLSTPLTPGSNPKLTPITIQATFRQGATNTTALSASTLTGTISVQGTPCFTSGAVDAVTAPGSVQGTLVNVAFKMNDGSTLTMLAYIQDTGTTKIDVYPVNIAGGACDRYGTAGNAELDKQ